MMRLGLVMQFFNDIWLLSPETNHTPYVQMKNVRHETPMER